MLRLLNYCVAQCALHNVRCEVLCSVAQGQRRVQLRTPVAGKVVDVNGRAERHAGIVADSPYESGWLVAIEPDELAEDLAHLRIGKPVAAWYQDEIERLKHAQSTTHAVEDWPRFERQFLDVGSDAV
jgi:glycine cleavage system H lipoate-binding protein